MQRPNIPAYAENYRVASVKAITSDTTLNSLWPHMHLRGKDMTYSVTYPDGREEILLSVPKYSFEWQLQYQFDEAIKLPAGSMLRVVAHYDNSAKNKFNPAPDQELPWGAQSWHEMYFPHLRPRDRQGRHAGRPRARTSRPRTRSQKAEPPGSAFSFTAEAAGQPQPDSATLSIRLYAPSRISEAYCRLRCRRSH